jgi:uncharacterized protein
MPMKEIRSFPNQIREIEHTLIPLADGAQLAARIWYPEGAETSPVPAILEYLPYPKRDDTALRDSMTQPYFAGYGYACVRVDIRGSGESDGILRDEYLPLEQQDGIEVLRWIAAQPWCDGNLGMIGKSWGGFNGLQIAAHRPPELKAIITVCSTDDRYADDVHYMGGCLLGDNLSWASSMFADLSIPPDPALVGERWRAMWRERLEENFHWLETWLSHQRRDDYWKQGSVCEDYRAIQCPVFAVSGWADGYSNSVFRLLANLDVPRKGLIGPWSHKYPHLGFPGPAIGFLQEALRWWDRWLKGIDTGVERDPMLRVYMQSYVPPTMYASRIPGRWVAEEAWPSPHIDEQTLELAPGLLAREHEMDDAPRQRPLDLQSPLSVGLYAGKWCSFTATPDLPHDQREEDGGALVFDSAALTEDLEILGAPVACLELSSSEPVAMICVRLSSVAPDFRTTRVTYGLLNLTHRDGHEHPELLEPGKRYRVEVRLNEIAQSIPAGNALRLALSTSYWPVAWPPPKSTRLTIYPDSSRLVLPVRAPRTTDAELPAFGEPEVAAPVETEMLEPRRYDWRVIRDLARDESTLEVIKDEGAYRFTDNDLVVDHTTVERYSQRANDFTSARGETELTRRLSRDGWSVKTVTRTVLTCDETHFRLRADLDAFEGEKRVFCRTWDRKIPRDHL